MRRLTRTFAATGLAVGTALASAAVAPSASAEDLPDESVGSSAVEASQASLDVVNSLPEPVRSVVQNVVVGPVAVASVAPVLSLADSQGVS